MRRNHLIHKHNPRRKSEAGQMIFLVAIMFLGLLAAVGLATDITILYKTKQDLQRAVDSVAVGASRQLPNETRARAAVYELLRLYGYNFDPSSKPVQISFPFYDPPRKAITVAATDVAEFAFLKLVGFNTTTVTADATAETAPLDIVMVIDLSMSMVYDTPRPYNWPTGAVGGCTNWSDDRCVTLYCNNKRNCDPLDAHIKPAVLFFLDQLDPTFDRLGLVSFDYRGRTDIGLTHDFEAVETAVLNMNAYDVVGKSTNTGDGLYFGHQNLAANGRLDAIWSMILLTDGRANVYRSCSGCPPNCGSCTTIYTCEECTAANNWALNNAADSWTRHETVIYTIAYGQIFVTDPDYKKLMIDIADRTDNGVMNGTTQNFWVAPNESGLRVALAEIAERLYSRLLR